MWSQTIGFFSKEKKLSSADFKKTKEKKSTEQLMAPSRYTIQIFFFFFTLGFGG